MASTDFAMIHTPVDGDPLLEVARWAIDGSPIELAGIDCDAFVLAAEAHQLAPLAHAAIGAAGKAPALALRQLDALVLRHRTRHRARVAALVELLDALDARSIRSAVLKGAALAWLIYSDPVLRPMNDIDVLVAPSDAPRARQVLAQLGYAAPPPAHRIGKVPHHLPRASRTVQGVALNVEIHFDALSRDTLTSIALDRLTEPLRPFSLGGRAASTLGHIDMLRHLSHHTIEPSWDGRVRRLGLVDLYRYAATFDADIDWERLERDDPFVGNLFGCLHQVIPLPPPLSRLAPPTPVRAPSGRSMRPLRDILRRDRGIGAVASDLFSPPAWWLHAYYGVPPGRSLVGVRVLRHPWRLLRWCGLRLPASS